MKAILHVEGRLGADAITRTSANGNEMVTFRIAMDDNVKGKKVTTWFNIISMNLGIKEYLKKGREVYVVGQETVTPYQTKTGELAVSRDILAYAVELGASAASGTTQTTATEVAQPKEEAPTEVPVPQPAALAAKEEVDDLPF